MLACKFGGGERLINGKNITLNFKYQIALPDRYFFSMLGLEIKSNFENLRIFKARVGGGAGK